MSARWFFAAALAAGTNLSVQAQTAAVSLSDASAQFKYSILVGGQSFGRNEMGFGVLYNNDDTLLGEVSLQVVNEAGAKAPGLDVGMGGKVFAATLGGNEDALALALGGHLRYSPRPAPRMALAGEAFYAPNIVSFMDMDNFWELAARLEYEVLPQAAAYIGYRRFAGHAIDDRTVEADESLYLGMRINF